jgi:hypothetical protein
MAKIPVGTIMLYAGDAGSSSVLNLFESGWLHRRPKRVL